MNFVLPVPFLDPTWNDCTMLWMWRGWGWYDQKTTTFSFINIRVLLIAVKSNNNFKGYLNKVKTFHFTVLSWSSWVKKRKNSFSARDCPRHTRFPEEFKLRNVKPIIWNCKTQFIDVGHIVDFTIMNCTMKKNT